MSKKIIHKAIALWADGDSEKSLILLKNIDSAFVQKRLAFLIKEKGEEAQQARQIYEALFSDKHDLASSEEQKNIQTIQQRQSDIRADSQTERIQDVDTVDNKFNNFKKIIQLPPVIVLTEAHKFLTLFSDDILPEKESVVVDFSAVKLAQIWSLVGLAALARCERENALCVDLSSRSSGARFAHALNFENLIENKPTQLSEQKNRSFHLTRIDRMDHIEHASRQIALMMVRDDDDTRKTLNYVLVELLRNAVQHSRDNLGGVVAAQLMDEPEYYPRPVVQVAVADCGIGILQALQQSYPEIKDPQQAIIKALAPHVSGTFAHGATGSTYNAGMGLFFISELAKLTAGRLVIATRGASYALLGDPEGMDSHETKWIMPKGTGYSGTLVTFELPINEIKDHESLLETVRKRAQQRTPNEKRQQWLRLQDVPPGVKTWAVRVVAEDVTKAEALAREQLHPRILKHESVALDFRGLDLATQSFLHALLFESLRLAWALRVEVYAVNAVPAVVSGLKLVDAYALSG